MTHVIDVNPLIRLCYLAKGIVFTPFIKLHSKAKVVGFADN